MNIAVILAGGNGYRLNSDIPKQFIRIAGKTILEHTLEVFQNNELINEIVVVMHPGYIKESEKIIEANNFTKVKKVLKGGKTRNLSSLKAILYYRNNPDYNILFHDVVRPFVTDKIINDVIEALKHYNAVDVAIIPTDTVIEIDENIIKSIPERRLLRRGQTPQGFKIETIKKAYDLALNDYDFKLTDDCSVVKKYLPNEPIYIVNGSENNIKITYDIDLFTADKLFQLKQYELINEMPLENLKDKVIIIFGGNSGIGLEIKRLAILNGAKVISFSRNQINIINKESINIELEFVHSEFRRIDYVINTAAILHINDLIKTSYYTIHEMIHTNYTGNINIAKESFEYLKESKGQLLLFTSSSYMRGRSQYSIYSSCKAAVVNFTQAIAEEWKEYDIKVNCICPERTKTPMRIKHFSNEPEESLLSPEVVAKKSLSVLLSNLTGQVINIKKNIL